MAAALFFLTIAACGTGDDPAALVCSYPAEDCSTGLFFGVCPGTAEPVFACNETGGHCRWFTGGCPIGHRASDCTSDDICCHDSPSGPWPFDDWTPASDMATQMLSLDVGAIGQTEVTLSSPDEIAVSIDASVGAPTSDVATCDAGAALQLCEDGTLMPRALRPRGDSGVVRFVSRHLFGQELLLDIVEVDGALHARLFLRDFTDAAGPDADVCPNDLYAPVATGGTLRLNTADFSTPDSVHGVLDFNTADAHAVSLSF
jgi:hypothetical protein